MEEKVLSVDNRQRRKQFLQSILRDIKALERLIEEGRIEKGVKRIGAEQELNFVDKSLRPALVGNDIYESLNKKYITTEYAKFNLEINSEPHRFSGDCLGRLKRELEIKLREVREVAKNDFNAEVVLTGILPTIRESDVTMDALTPEPRFKALLDTVTKNRGRKYEFNIKGIDELITRNNPSVFGGCFTSFQIHLQVDADDAAEKYNWSQAISGPVLAAATNSPMFLGKRLWRETRIALFQQTSDTRRPYNNYKQEEARVTFGQSWVKNSIVEVFKDDVAMYKAYLSTESNEDSLAKVEKGEVPELRALNFFNGTVYRWNRPCYGITGGKPHLRIENRIIPSGPTLEDQIANAALWLGVMNNMPEQYRDLPDKMEFSTAKDNFLKAARMGLEVQFKWFDGKVIPAHELLLNELIPMAYEGLEKEHIDKADIEHYLGIIEERVTTGKTGSQWILDSFNSLQKTSKTDDAIVATTAGMIARQNEGYPVHTWELPQLHEAGDWKSHLLRVDQIMTASLYTVHEDDVVDLAAHIMLWKNIGHVPVEDDKGCLVGLITKSSLITFLVEEGNREEKPIVKDMMLTDLITVPPDMLLTDAIELFLNKRVSCLPVTRNGRPVGIVTEHDFVTISKYLFRELKEISKEEDNED